MTRYNNLLHEIAEALHIEKGSDELETVYKKRIVYSALGKLVLASLWDSRDENEDISVTHFKRRIKRLARAYSSMYPELHADFSQNSDALSEEIYKIYLNTGHIYHSPKRISPAAWKKEQCDRIIFHRGQPINKSSYMSGLGFYQFCDETDESLSKVTAMFHLTDGTFYDRWMNVTNHARWSEFHGSDQWIEYLRTQPPFQYGYWIDKSDCKKDISMLRIGKEGRQLYCLCRYANGKLLTSPLPEWMTQEYQYRALAVGCLSTLKTLPAITYRIDGNIALLQFGYLLPPAELDFVKLYSWPKYFNNFPCDFSRVMNKEIFFVVKKILEQTGFEWIEV